MTDSVTSHNENLGGEQSSPSAEVEELFARLDRWIPAGQLADRAKLRQVFGLAAKADEYRIEADCGLRDFDRLEVSAGILEDGLREIAQGRRNKPFDPWARDLASRTLTSALANPVSATANSVGPPPEPVPMESDRQSSEKCSLCLGRPQDLFNGVVDDAHSITKCPRCGLGSASGLEVEAGRKTCPECHGSGYGECRNHDDPKYPRCATCGGLGYIE